MPSTFPNGCHVAEVEIDPDTGVITIVRYTGISDFGTVVNPMMVAGQLHGGVAQGIGQALMEEVRYDDSGQPITGSFMDYAMPRAEDIPMMDDRRSSLAGPDQSARHQGLRRGRLRRQPVDGGQRRDRCAVGSTASTHLDMPLTTEKIWRAIKDAKGAQAA